MVRHYRRLPPISSYLPSISMERPWDLVATQMNGLRISWKLCAVLQTNTGNFPISFLFVRVVLHSNLPTEQSSSGTYLSLSHRRYTLEWQSSNSQTQSNVPWSRVTVQLNGRACYLVGLVVIITKTMSTGKIMTRPDPLLCPTKVILISRSNNLLTKTKTQPLGSCRLLKDYNFLRANTRPENLLFRYQGPAKSIHSHFRPGYKKQQLKVSIEATRTFSYSRYQAIYLSIRSASFVHS